MKVDTLVGNTVKSRFEDSDTEDFEIAPEAHALVMKYLTDIYDDPVLAAVRETISNAFDAHQEAGVSEKIKITVSSLGDSNPYFEVTDVGVGMDKFTLKKVYVKYGISTKRSSDESIGGFGLGCKSPLAIEDKFFVETTKDGYTYVAENFTSNEGKFKQEIIDEYESEKPNGTTVRINLEKTGIYAVHEKLKKFLKYVDPTLYEATTSNGVKFDAPYALADKEKYHLISESDDFKVYANLTPDYYDTQTIVMGNVAYNFNIPQSVLSRTKLDRESLKVVIVAPINSVTITTSRENTQDTKKTKLFLEKAYLQYENDINEFFQNYVDQAETPKEVYKRVREAQRFCRRSYKYKGEDIQEKLKLEHLVMYAYKRYGSSPARGNTTEVSLAGNDNIFLVANDKTPETKEGAITRAYNAFLSKRSLDRGTFYFLDDKEPKIDSWWVTENPNIRFIKKGDILTEAAEYRKEQRRLKGPNRRTAGKVKYAVVDNEVGEKADDSFIQHIEYPEIEKGVPYLTMEDIVAYGITRSQNDAVDSFRNRLKSFLDFFDYSGEILILDKGKKEETMLKRVKAEKLEFDFLALEQYTEAAKKRAYSNSVRAHTSYVESVKNLIGDQHFTNLVDPRFTAYLKEYSPEDVMDEEQYRQLHNFISQAFNFGYNDYYRENRDKINELKAEWRNMTSYWYNMNGNTTRAKIERLRGMYENHISMNIGSSNAKLVVDIYNTIYNDYLTSREKML